MWCNYRLTHSASELSGFTCTSSLTMNEKFHYRTRLCRLRYWKFRVQVNPDNCLRRDFAQKAKSRGGTLVTLAYTLVPGEYRSRVTCPRNKCKRIPSYGQTICQSFTELWKKFYCVTIQLKPPWRNSVARCYLFLVFFFFKKKWYFFNVVKWGVKELFLR